MWKMGYLTVLHVRLGAKIGELHAKDSHSFRNKQILIFFISDIKSRYLTHNVFRLYIILVLGGLLLVIFAIAVCILYVSYMRSVSV